MRFGRTEESPVRGYLYVPHDSDGPVRGAEVGKILRTPELAPPYIVVDHEAAGIIVSSWPGRLFEVETLPSTSRRERKALSAAARELVDNPGYTRTFAIKVLDELSPGLVFGPDGDRVSPVIDAAGNLSGDDLDGPLARRVREAEAAYDAAWRRWFSSAGPEQADRDFERVLAVSGASGCLSSPIGDALLVTARAVYNSAESLGGVVDGDDDESHLTPEWQIVESSLLHAAMAMGAGQWLSADEITAMTKAWDASRFGAK